MVEYLIAPKVKVFTKIMAKSCYLASKLTKRNSSLILSLFTYVRIWYVVSMTLVEGNIYATYVIVYKQYICSYMYICDAQLICIHILNTTVTVPTYTYAHG